MQEFLSSYPPLYFLPFSHITVLFVITDLTLFITISLSPVSLKMSKKLLSLPSHYSHTMEEQHKPKENILTVTSPLSSPAHEFSFTITLHPSPNHQLKNTKDRSSSLDLAPADDIFFHGHLLPLHLLSHQPPVSPRPSSACEISVEGLLSLPKPDTTAATSKTKSFGSLFGLTKWWRSSEKRKPMFDISRLWRKYTSLIEPLFLSRREKGRRDLRRRPYSFSGSSTPKEVRGGWMTRRRRGQFSAPASARTSPTNSGLLLATPTALSATDESSMEELQNAIKAAIAHCKNSTTGKDSDGCMQEEPVRENSLLVSSCDPVNIYL